MFAAMLHRYWAVGLGGVSANGAPAALEAHAALLDSGTSLLLASDSDAAAINGVRSPWQLCHGAQQSFF